MKTILLVSAVSLFLVALPSSCFALWDVLPVAPELAKEMGMEVRSTMAGANHVRVELEFGTAGALKNLSHVDLQIGEGDSLSLTAPLREDRSQPGRVMVSFSTAAAQLPKLTLLVYVQGGAGGTLYELRLKKFVVLKKDKKGTTDLEFEFHRGKVPATELKVELVAGKHVAKDKRGLVLPLEITNAAGEVIRTTRVAQVARNLGKREAWDEIMRRRGRPPVSRSKRSARRPTAAEYTSAPSSTANLPRA